MSKKEIRERQIQVFQDNLASIRKIGGWTAEEFGDMIGVTKQTIGNIENKKTKMSLAQYIALRAMLDYEIKLIDEQNELKSEEKNNLLKEVVVLLLDYNDELSEEEYKNISENIKIVASAIAGGATVESLATYLGVGATSLGALGAVLGATSFVGGAATLLGGLVAGPIIGGTVGALWLTKVAKDKKKKKK